MDLHAELAAAEAGLERLSAGAFLADPAGVAREALALLTPPELISTTDCAARYRYLPNKEGGGATLWSAVLTPYINGIQDALDDPAVGLVIVPKPGRVGGTVAAENHMHKRLKFGPLTDMLWYMPSDSEVDSYVDRTVTRFFDLHDDIRAKIGPRRSDNKLDRKRVMGRLLEWLQINKRTITGRDAGYIVGDEIDAAAPRYRATFVDQVRVRGTTAGSSFKGYLCSHMDAGWTSGIAAAWKESSRGIWYWPCPQCGGFSSPCPAAPKGWRTMLDYERPAGVSDDELLDRVEATAGLKCPHCGKKAADIDKPAMLLRGIWVHEGQTIAVDGTVTGEPRSKRVLGFWIHGTMSPWVGFGDLARRYVSALIRFERTRKSDRLREVSAKVLGEVYEGGPGAGKAIDPAALQARTRAAPAAERFQAGTAPSWVRFVVASVDVGNSRFDVLVRGFDLEGRSAVIERFTIYEWKGRNVRPAERIDDWGVLEHRALNLLVPLADDPNMAMTIAGVAIDTGGGKALDEDEPAVTWKAREFARRMLRKKASGANGYRIRLVKGFKRKGSEEIIGRREINRDDKGRPVSPSVIEFNLNVDALKAKEVERLAATEGPGTVLFADGLPDNAYTELAGEVLIDGQWERRGANETLDLLGYSEAVRILLDPDRADIKWETRPPVWARPIPLKAEADAAPAQGGVKMSAIDRLAALNRAR